MEFFDVRDQLAELSKKGDPLKRLSQTADFELFRPEFERAAPRSDRAKGGRPPYDHIVMFKVLMIETLYTLSDEQTEFQIKDRLSFQRFLGFGLGDSVPDAIRPDVDVAPGREIALLPAPELRLPDSFQPAKDGRRQVGRVLAEQGGERLLKVAARSAAQIENRQQRIQAFGASRVARQDGRRKVDPISLIGAAITNSGLTDLDRPDGGLDAALGQMTMTHRALPPVCHGEISMRLKHRCKFGLDGLCQQLSRSSAQDNNSTVGHGVSLLWEIWLARHRHDTPPPFRPPSPTSPHRSAVWKHDYNTARPHSRLDWLTPSEFARTATPMQAMAIGAAYTEGSAPRA